MDPAFDNEEIDRKSSERFEILANEAPLPAVLISVAWIDRCLAQWLSRFLVSGSTSEKMLKSGILSDFRQRSEMCYVLGLISKDMFGNLIHLGEIRNRFAHHDEPIDFTDTQIVAFCEQLKSPTHWHDDHAKAHPISAGDRKLFDSLESRTKFTRCAVLSMIQLESHAYVATVTRCSFQSTLGFWM